MEEFFKCYEHTLEFLGVLATFCAVGLSLWLARRSEQLRIIARAGLWNEIGNKQKTICVSITNVGLRTAYFPELFCHYTIPFSKTATLFLTEWPESHRQIDSGRQRLVTLLTLENFHRVITENSDHIKFFKKLRLYFLRIEIFTEQGLKFNVSMSKDVKREVIRAFKINKSTK